MYITRQTDRQIGSSRCGGCRDKTQVSGHASHTRRQENSTQEREKKANTGKQQKTTGKRRHHGHVPRHSSFDTSTYIPVRMHKQSFESTGKPLCRSLCDVWAHPHEGCFRPHLYLLTYLSISLVLANYLSTSLVWVSLFVLELAMSGLATEGGACGTARGKCL